MSDKKEKAQSSESKARCLLLLGQRIVFHWNALKWATIVSCELKILPTVFFHPYTTSTSCSEEEQEGGGGSVNE